MLRNRLWPLRLLRGPRELALFAEATAIGSIVPVAMRLPLPRLGRLLASGRPVTQRGPIDAERVAQLVGLAPVVWHPVVRGGCLTRGVTLYWLLRRRGVPVELRFGVHPAGEADGHCWLTLGDEPYLEKVDPRSRWVETYRMPAAA